MKDLKNATIEEMDAMSITPILDEEENVVLDPDNYWEEHGIRFYKKPLRVDFGYWACSTTDHDSIVIDKGDAFIIYVFANAISKEGDVALVKWYKKEHLGKLGYRMRNGLSSTEVNAV